MIEEPTAIAIGVDVGGSGIKVGVVDVARGELLAPRLRIATPNPSTPASVVPAIIRTIRRAVKGSPIAVAPDAPVGVQSRVGVGTTFRIELPLWSSNGHPSRDGSDPGATIVVPEAAGEEGVRDPAR